MFEAYNDDGSLQFNAASYAFYFVGKGVLTVANQYTSGPTYTGTYGSVTVPYDYDLVFFSSPNVAVQPKNISTTTNFAGTITVKSERVPIGLGEHTDLEFYCFRSMRSLSGPAAHGVGLELYNADGSICYSTVQGGDPLMVVNNADINAFTAAWTAGVTMGAGTWAWMLYGTVQAGSYIPHIKTRSTGWDGKAVASSPIGVQPTTPITSAGGILGVDVSRY